MVSLSSITVFLIIFQVFNGNCLNIPMQEKIDVDDYAKEFSRLLNNGTGLKRSSSENYLGRHNEDSSNPMSDDVLHSHNQRLSSEIVLEGSSSISPAKVPESSDQFESLEKDHYLSPFIIDEELSLSPTRNQSKECILDRKHITLIFQECIYHNQTKLPMQDNKNVTISDPSLRDYDAHFLRYCRRAPELRVCVKNFIVRTKEHCLDEGDHETISNLEVVTEYIIKFICNKEADRISIFIADGGLECLLSKHYRMYACLMFNLGNYALISIAELASLDLRGLKCTTLRGVEMCITKELELCEHQVSAIATGVLFNVIKEIASCQDSTEELTEDLADKLATFSPKVSSDLDSDGQNQQEEDEMPTTSPYLDSAMANDAPIYPDKDPQSTSSSIVESGLVSGKDKMSTISPAMSSEISHNMTSNDMFNAAVAAHNLSVATAGMLCALVIFYSVITLSYKCMINDIKEIK